ncbi:MAG: ABC-2 type transport system permease protein [Flavobacteriales bacterium]|jgi:ABC-2 type transport system permease protein
MTKRQDIIQFAISLLILGVAFFICQLVFAKIDLTEEKRHTLTEATTELLDSVDNQVLVRCYLHGDFPAKFKRLEKAIKERLDEFHDLSGGRVEYEFIDPYAIDDKKTQGEIETALYEQGLEFTRLSYEENGVKKFKTIWPGAIMSHNGKELAVQLFKSNSPEPTDAMVNGSINNIEFELGSKMRQLMSSKRKSVAFIEGHGELSELETIDLGNYLAESYEVSRVQIDEKIGSLSEKLDHVKHRTNSYDLLIIAKPDSIFSDKDKVIIDQYIMNGGKILWLLDPILTDLDSLRERQGTMGITNEMGLYDMLFDYGVRLNRDMVIDYQCAPIAFDAGPMGNQRNMEMFNWYFSPVVIAPDNAHPIAANLDPIVMQFTSSLESVGDDKRVQKSVLLASSDLSKQLKAPIRVNSGVVQLGIDYFQANPNPNLALAMLLEGTFTSNFQYRLPDAIQNDPTIAFREESVHTKMIVVADGDIARNGIMDGGEGPIPVPLGYDRYIGNVVYDNREFLLNAVNYLLDDKALISMRSRSIILRKLNEEKILQERSRWQVINVALPLFLLIVFGVLQFTIRKKKYASH